MRVRRRAPTRRISTKSSTATKLQPQLPITNANQTPQFSDSEYARTDHVEHDESETGLSTPPLPPPRFLPVERRRGNSVRTKKRRATSPPQESDNERRSSTDTYPQSLSIADDLSDRANSMSSVNSYTSINAAYATLDLNSPGNGQSSGLMSSSPNSATSDNMQQSDIPRAMSALEVMKRAIQVRANSVGKAQGFYICDCCPMEPRKSIPAKSLSKSYNSRNPGLQLYLPMNLLVNDTNPEPTGRRSNMNVLTVGTYSRTKMRQSDMPAHYTTVAPHGLSHCSAISTEPSTTRGLNPAKPTLAGFVVLISTGQPRRGTLDTRRTTTGRSVLLTFGSNTNSVNATLQRISTASITFDSTSGTRMELCWGTGRRN